MITLTKGSEIIITCSLQFLTFSQKMFFLFQQTKTRTICYFFIILPVARTVISIDSLSYENNSVFDFALIF